MDKSGEEKIKILAFTQSSKRLAVPLSYVKGMCKVKGVTRVPGLPPFITGVVYARGEIVALIALEYFWDWRPNSKNSRSREFLIAILEREHVSFGVEIGRNIQIRDVPLSLLDNEGVGEWRKEFPYILSIIPDGGETIYLIDLSELMISSELYTFVSSEE
jgi:purine-binding chemotaxis protein CheW